MVLRGHHRLRRRISGLLQHAFNAVRGVFSAVGCFLGTMPGLDCAMRHVPGGVRPRLAAMRTVIFRKDRRLAAENLAHRDVEQEDRRLEQ